MQCHAELLRHRSRLVGAPSSDGFSSAANGSDGGLSKTSLIFMKENPQKQSVK
jgi:hypothetical protein